MGKFVKGDTVDIPFLFSDLTKTKRRPALVISSLEADGVILCQITSQSIKDKYAVLIKDRDFESGELKQISNVRQNRIFTADSSIVLYKAARLKIDKLNRIIGKSLKLFVNKKSIFKLKIIVRWYIYRRQGLSAEWLRRLPVYH